MLLLFLLLSSICLRAASQATRTASDCTIGLQWTDTYIRSECFQGAEVKGVRALGCVPSNTDNGTMIDPGATFNEKYFTYSCSKSGEIVSYKIINCRDSTGKNLAVNENRTMADGSRNRCYKDASGAIKLAQDSFDGCLYDGVTYTPGKAWTEPTEFKATIAGAIKLIGKGVRMQCKKEGDGFIGVASGCVLASGKALNNGKLHTENKITIKCVIVSNGTVTMTAVDDRDLSCTFDKVEVKNGEKYTTPDGIDVYTCVFGIMKKISCIIDGKPYGSDTLVTTANKTIYCNKASGYVDFGSTTGCTLPDGSIKPFYSSWVVGSEVRRCYYTIKNNIVTAYSAFWRCSFNGKWLQKWTVATDGKTYFKKCTGHANGTYGMRDLTEAEITAYLNARKAGGSTSEFGGAEGEAGGETIALRKPLPIIPSDSCPTAVPMEPKLCPSLPSAVPEVQYPGPWIKGTDLVITKEINGTLDIITCPNGTVGQMGPGAKAFTFTEAYHCDPASEKWVHSGDNYEAPPLLSCGRVPNGQCNTYCGIVHEQSNGAQGIIAIYPENEQICPIGQTLKFADGRAIMEIECTGAGLKIVDGEGAVSNPSNPKLTCVPGCVPRTSIVVNN